MNKIFITIDQKIIIEILNNQIPEFRKEYELLQDMGIKLPLFCHWTEERTSLPNLTRIFQAIFQLDESKEYNPNQRIEREIKYLEDTLRHSTRQLDYLKEALESKKAYYTPESDDLADKREKSIHKEIKELLDYILWFFIHEIDNKNKKKENIEKAQWLRDKLEGDFIIFKYVKEK